MTAENLTGKRDGTADDTTKVGCICDAGKLWISFLRRRSTVRWDSATGYGLAFRGIEKPVRDASPTPGIRSRSVADTESMQTHSPRSQRLVLVLSVVLLLTGIGRALGTPLTADAGPDQEICIGSPAVLGGNPTASGGDLGWTYNWSPAAGLDYIRRPNPTARPAITMVYTVTVIDSGGHTATSSVTVTVDPTTVGGTASPAATHVCSGTGTTIGLSGQTGGIVKWQASTDGASSWSDIASTTSPLSTGDLTQTTEFRAVVQSGLCSPANSSVATVTVDAVSVGGTASPAAMHVCSGTGTTIGLSGQTGEIIKWQASTDAGTSWSDIASTANPLSTGDLTQATEFRAVVQSGVCLPANSSAALVTIDTAPGVTTDISSQTVCAGVAATWSVVASGSGLSYQWQRDGTNLVEGVGNFTGTSTSTLTNSAVALEDALDATRGYVCIVSGICTPAARSATVALTVEPVLVGGVTTAGTSEVCSGSGTTISLGGNTGAIVKWQASTDGGLTWSDIGSTDNPLSTGNLTQATEFRAVVHGGVCSPANSSAATVTVDAVSVGGTANPAATHVCSGTGTTIGLSGQTGGIVKWQASTDGGSSWSDIASTANPLSTGDLTQTAEFRAVVQSGVCSPANSSVATVTVDAVSVGGTASPAATHVCSGTGTTIGLSGQTGEIVKWQASTDGGSSWSDIASTTNPLSTGHLTQTTEFRAVVQSGVCSPANSSAAPVTITTAPGITTDISSQTVCAGVAATWSVVASGSGLSYQWQRDGTNLVEGVGSFTGTTSSTLTNSAVAPEDALDAARGYACIVSGSCTPAARSATVALTVEPVLVGGVTTAGISEVCSGVSTSISLGGNTGAIVKWQASTDGGLTWSDIGSTDNPLVTGNLTQTTEFRAVVHGGVCSPANSSAAIVTVATAPAITTDITNQTVCAGAQMTWSVVASGRGLGYQWQRDGTNLVEGVGNFTGTSTPTLTNSAVALEDALEAARGYVCAVSGTCTPAARSSTVALTVDPISVGGAVTAGSLEVCSGTGTSISLAGNTGAIVEWQISTNGGSTWSVIHSTDNPLTTGPLIVATQFRALVQSGACTTANSRSAAVTVNAATAGGTATPAATHVCSGTGTTIGLSGQTGTIVKWQTSTDSGLTWSDIGSTDNPLSTGNLTQTTEFRAVVQIGVCSPANSSAAVVAIGSAPAVTTDITNQEVCAGVHVTWSVVASGSGLSYQWQRDGTNLVEGVGNFTGTTSATLTNSAVVPEDALDAARGYACAVSGTCAPAAHSSRVSLRVDPVSVGGSAVAGSSEVCSGTGTTIGLSGQTGTIVKWQASTDAGSTWLDNPSSANPLATGNLTNNTLFRAVVTNGVCGPVYSIAAAVSVQGPSASATSTAIACHGGSSTVTVTASGGAAPYTGTGDFTATAGLHTYTVTDANGCTTSARVTITEPAVLLASATFTPITQYGGTSTVTVAATGGTTPYTGTGDFTAPAGSHTYTVTDTKGCTASVTVTITEPAPPHEPMGPSSRKTPIVFSEIMYKPALRADANNLEYVEIYNSNPWFHDISGYQIVCADMNYTFPAGTIIQGGAYLVVAASPQSIQNVYGIANVMGPYTGSLKRAESLQLMDERGAVLLTVPYSNVYPWPVAAIGTGHSIILANPTYGEGDARAWAISDVVGGSPGQIDTFHPNPLRDVVINELLAHSEEPGGPQFIELYNHSTQTNDLSGCILTDDVTTNKFIVPANTLIEPQGFAAFNLTQLGFALNGGGGTVYFIKPDGSRVLDAVQFEGQADGVSFGRWPDGANAFYSLASQTPGTSNSAVRIGDIVINELMYKPISANDDDQYIELYNKGSSPVSLANWMFTAGISFTFPANITLAPDSYLVIARNLTNLFAKYPNLNAGNTLGNYGGKLSHNGERVALAMPQLLTGTNSQGATITTTIYVVQDEVTYGTGGRWGQWAAGGGSSLELIDPRANHRLAANWADSDDTQKSAWVDIQTTGVLDNGQNYDPSIQRVQIGLLDVGECLVDAIEVRAGVNGPNLMANPDFESGLGNWSLQGDHCRSSLENSGYASSYSLHLRSSNRIWTGENSCQGDLNANSLGAGQTATLRFKARWLRGWPEALLRLNGNWLEATGRLAVPANLGTPGIRNSQYVPNAGPAIYEVQHTPAIPAANQAVVVTARAHNPNGVQSLVLNYRLDPATSYTAVTMKDDSTGGDAIAGDGIFSATIPGQSSNSIAAFYIAAADTQGATTRFPPLLNDNSPVRECVVRFGDANPGGSFGVYHLWITQTNAARWTRLSDLSNEPNGCTMVSGTRVIYNAQGQFQGSPYHQDFDTPSGNLCHYKWVFPDDDQFLGATSFNKLHQPGNSAGDDTSLQREQTANMFLRALGVPWLNRRYVVVYVNGSRRGALMEDAQTPDADVVKEHFPNDSDGWLYKMQPWLEFEPQRTSPYMDYYNMSWCNLMPYTTTGGVKKPARYRWNFLLRRTPDSASNFTNVFSLVDAASSYGTPGYAGNMQNLADMENWMRVFAANHAAGNWDSFGALYGQNLYCYIGPLGTKSTLLMFDFNVVLSNSSSWGPGEHLFTVNDQDTNTANIYREPVFRRMYLRALQELVNGPLNPANSGPLLDAKYSAFVANGLSVEDPNTRIKPWLRAAHDSIASQIAAENAAAFTVNASVVVSNDVALVSGTAPVGVKTIWFNGTEYPVTWTGVSSWTVSVPLHAGSNQFSVVGVDIHGQPIAGDTGNVTAVYSGAVPSPVGQVVINEIMYHPPLAGTEYVELYNTTGTTTFDLSGWQFHGLSYTFPAGSLMGPGSFLVLAVNRAQFAAAYGATIPVFDTFGGFLQTDGETLSLTTPGGQVVTQVRYQNWAPWPMNANGTGASLQLIDPLQDNWRAGNWTAIQSNPGSSTPGKTNSVALALTPFPPLWINELQADNLTGITNRAGQRTAWLEIYNPGTNTVSLNDLWLADTYANLGQWPFPANLVINPGQFKVIFADSQTSLSTTDELHTSFTLPSGSGSLALSRFYNGQYQVLDFIDYTNLPANYSYGSFPDGQSFHRQQFFAATPGGTNLGINLPPPSFIAYTSPGSVYAQNFDALPNPGLTSVNTANPVTVSGITYSFANPFDFAFPAIAGGNIGGLGIAALAGWYGMADPAASVGTRFGATAGDQTTGGILSFGSPNSGNRSLGLLATSTTGFTAFGAKFINQTAQTLNYMSLQLMGEVWRQSNLPKTLQFHYLIDPTATAAFSTNLTGLIASLNVSFPTVPADTGGVAVDGTSSVNQTNLGVVDQAINWPPGAALWLVWEMADPTGKAQGLAIDNLNFSASHVPMGPPVSFIPYTIPGSVYAQNFDTLPNPGSTSVNTANPVTINGITYSLANPFDFAAPVAASGNNGGLGIAALAGWHGMANPAAGVGTRFGATAGDQTTGGILSFGLPNSGNRALGLLATSTTGFTAFGAKFINRTAQTLNLMTLQLTGEVWRQSNLPKTLQFYYLVEPTAAVPFSTNLTALVPSLNVSLPTVPADTGGVAVDGTSSVNQTNLGVVNQPINWPPGAALWLVWEMADPTGKAQGLGIDNLTFSAINQPISIPVPLTIQSSGTNVTFSWPTVVGQMYQPEYSDDLGTSNWISLGPPIAGTGSSASFTNDLDASHRFFRLRLLPP